MCRFTSSARPNSSSTAGAACTEMLTSDANGVRFAFSRLATIPGRNAWLAASATTTAADHAIATTRTRRLGFQPLLGAPPTSCALTRTPPPG